MTQAYSYYTSETEVGGAQIQDQPHLHSKLQANKGCWYKTKFQQNKKKAFGLFSIDAMHAIIKHLCPSHGENLI